MPVFNGGTVSFPESTYLFIDGAYLRKTLEKYSEIFFNNETITVDYKALTLTHDTCKKSFYYDCPPPESDSEYDIKLLEYESRTDSIMSAPGFHVIDGITRGTGKKIKQKTIDVMIAVDMLKHAYNGNMQKCVFLTGDLDFLPIVTSLVDIGIYVTLWYEKSSTSKLLIQAADTHRVFDLNTIFSIADKEFLEKYPRPQSFSSAKDPRGYTLHKNGKSQLDKEVGLYKNNEGFMVVFEDSSNKDFFIHVRHRDKSLLEMYTKENFGITCNWIE